MVSALEKPSSELRQSRKINSGSSKELSGIDYSAELSWEDLRPSGPLMKLPTETLGMKSESQNMVCHPTNLFFLTFCEV